MQDPTRWLKEYIVADLKWPYTDTTFIQMSSVYSGPDLFILVIYNVLLICAHLG